MKRWKVIKSLYPDKSFWFRLKEYFRLSKYNKIPIPPAANTLAADPFFTDAEMVEAVQRRVAYLKSISTPVEGSHTVKIQHPKLVDRAKVDDFTVVAKHYNHKGKLINEITNNI